MPDPTQETSTELKGDIPALDEAADRYDQFVKILKDRWEAKITTLRVPPQPTPKDILLLVSKIDELSNNVATDLSKIKSVVNDLKDQISTTQALAKDEAMRAHPDWKAPQINDAVKVHMAQTGLTAALVGATAKLNYMTSVSERLKRKKELLATDRDIMNMSKGLHIPQGDR